MEEKQMQTKTKLLFNLMVLVALVVSTIGCRSNGGAWYDARSYSLYNPFRLEDHSHNGATTVADNQPAKPHMDPRVDIKQPDGGYSTITQTSTTDLNGRDATQGYPIQRTTYHSEQPMSGGSTVTPSGSYGGTPPAYGGFNNAVASPVTPSGYGQPTYNQPAGLNPPSSYQQPMNDSSSLPNPYSVPQHVPAGYPAATNYQSEGNYSSNLQDNGSYGTTVAGPFASPAGQPSAGSALPASTYGAGTPNGYGNPIDQNPAGTPVYSGQPTGNPNSAVSVQNPPVGYTAGGAIPTSSGGVLTATPSNYR
jgi:hypothetical protein